MRISLVVLKTIFMSAVFAALAGCTHSRDADEENAAARELTEAQADALAQPATASASAPAQPVTMPDVYEYTDFSDDNLGTKQGPVAGVGIYSEKPGDALSEAAVSTGGIGSLSGWLSNINGSTFAGLFLSMPSIEAEGKDLSMYKQIKIELASEGTNQKFEVRLLGNRDDVRFRGCYPVAHVNVTNKLTEYTIQIDDETFPQLHWCKGMDVPVADTIKAVKAVEVLDTGMPSKPKSKTMTEIRVGKIRFTK